MDINHDITLEEIYIPSKEVKDTYLCEDFIVYPDGKEKNGGYLLGVIEMRATDNKESDKIVQAIINTLKDEYYTQISASPEPEKLNLETVFEYALQKTNDTIHEMIQIGHINFSPENLNYAIAIAKPNPKVKDIDFIFVQQGLIQVFLLHKTKQNNYKVINIIDNTPRLKEEQNSKLKIFSSVLSGKVYFHDTLYLCSEMFGNYIPSHKINKILSTNDLGTSIDYFKNLINNVKNNSYLTYCSIFVKMEEKRAIQEKLVSQQSIDDLISTTEKNLTPTFALNIRGTISNIVGKLFSKKSESKIQGFRQQTKLRFGFLKYIFNIFKMIAISIYALFTKLFNLITGKEKLVDTLAKPRQAIEHSKEKLKSLHKINKTIIIVIIALILVFIGSIALVRYRQGVKTQVAQYEASIRQIKDQLDNAEVDLIYKNNAASLEAVRSAEEKINALPKKTKTEQSNINDLSRQLASLKNKLINLEKVAPQVIAEVIDNGQNTNLFSLAKIGDNFYVAGKTQKIFQITSDKKVIEFSSFEGNGDINSVTYEDNNLFVFTNQNKVLKIDIGLKTTKLQNITWGNVNLQAIKLFNSNIYTLDNTQQQIFKYTGNDDGFGDQQIWSKDKKEANLTEATDIAIDSNIYVLTKNGQIYKFLKGQIQNFTLEPVEPAITDGSKIFTTADLKNIYVSDKASKRIIVFDKNGKFIKQYSFESSPEINNIFIDKDTTIYFLADNKLYQAPIK